MKATEAVKIYWRIPPLGLKRAKRVQEWTELVELVSVASSSVQRDNVSSKKRRQESKSFLDALRSDKRSYVLMELSSYFPLDAYSLKMADMDQYLGMNNLNYNGRQCHLINWRTASSKGADTQESVLLDAGDISKVITKGRALENNVGAPNL